MAAGLATGTPEPRNARFLREAALTLAAAQQRSVRAAVEGVDEWLQRHPELTPDARASMISSVRDISTTIAECVRDHRLEVLEELAHADRIDNVRASFDNVVDQTSLLDPQIAATSVELAEQRLGGAEVSAGIDAAVAGAVMEERFAHELEESATPPHRLTFAEWRAMGLGRVELAVGWMTDVVRILVEASTQEHAEWFSPRVDAATVVATRSRIQRYARDMSFNIAVIMALLLIMIAAIASAARW